MKRRGVRRRFSVRGWVQSAALAANRSGARWGDTIAAQKQTAVAAETLGSSGAIVGLGAPAPGAAFLNNEVDPSHAVGRPDTSPRHSSAWRVAADRAAKTAAQPQSAWKLSKTPQPDDLSGDGGGDPQVDGSCTGTACSRRLRRCARTASRLRQRSPRVALAHGWGVGTQTAAAARSRRGPSLKTPASCRW